MTWYDNRYSVSIVIIITVRVFRETDKKVRDFNRAHFLCTAVVRRRDS